MALEIRRGKSRWWYGRIEVDGKKLFQNLGVEIKGTIPKTLRETGDTAFERSRERAQMALEALQRDYKKRSTAQEIVTRLHELRTGEKIASLPLDDLSRRWKDLPRRKKPSERYAFQVSSCIGRFVDFLKTKHSAVTEVGSVQASHAREFLKQEETRGVSPKTYNNTLILLRSVFEAVAELAGSPKNAFAKIPTKFEDTVFRKPFSEQELSRILQAAKGDPFIRPIIVTGACTAMRRGDCCMLLWKAVDLKDRFVAVKTSKTGETVRIPIFPMLEEVLRAAHEARKGSPFVFPEQARMYQLNPDGITLRVRAVLEQAGFRDPNEYGANPDAPTGHEVHQRRTNGLRRASVRDFHSFRVTWVTLALSSGVPMELVQKVTGHRTAQIVTKHYFQPGKEEFRKALSAKLPALMGGVQPERLKSVDALKAKLEAMTPENWQVIRDELVAGLG